MNKYFAYLLLINLPALAMESNSQRIPTKQVPTLTRSVTPNSNKTEVGRPIQLLNVTENTKVPVGHTMSEKVSALNKKIAKTTDTIIDGVNQPFKTWFGVINYLKSTKKTERYICLICKGEYIQSTLAAGCFLHHFDSTLFYCDACGCDMQSYMSYKKHTQCNPHLKAPEQAKNTTVLIPAVVDEQYLKDVVNQKTEAINCCDSSLGNWATALNHTSLIHKKARVKYTCNSCLKDRSTNEKALECYVKHKDDSIFNCPACNQQHDTRNALLKHICQKSNKSDAPEKDTSVSPSNLTNNNNCDLQELSMPDTNAPLLGSDSVFSEGALVDSCWASSDDYEAVYHNGYDLSLLNPLHSGFDYYSADPSYFGSSQTSATTQPFIIDHGSAYNYDPSFLDSHVLDNRVVENLEQCEDDHELPQASTDLQFVQHPFELEGQVFDAAGSQKYNRTVLGKLVLSRLYAHSYSCCTQKNRTFDNLRKHLREKHVHASTGKIVCPQCNTIPANITLACHHVALHQHPDLFNCPLCASKHVTTPQINKFNLDKHFHECLAEHNESQGIINVHQLVQNSFNLANSLKQLDRQNEQRAIKWVDYSGAEYHKNQSQ